MTCDGVSCGVKDGRGWRGARTTGEDMGRTIRTVDANQAQEMFAEERAAPTTTTTTTSRWRCGSSGTTKTATTVTSE